MKFKTNWDAVGIATSLICAIHCALLPVLVTFLPVLGLNISHNSAFEWIMIAFAFVIGVYSLSHGYIKHHRSMKPILLFATGFFFLAAKQFSSYHLWFLLIAVSLIITSHYINFRLCHKSKCSDPHHKH